MPTVKEIVSQLPEPDDRGLYSKIDKTVVDNATAELQQGGKQSLLALIDMIKEPGNHQDYKAHYVLYCWAVQVGKAKKEKDRRLFAETLASQIGGGRSKAVQKYLVQQLQVAGRREVIGTLGALLTDEELCEPAAQALTAIREGALGQYRKALAKAKGKCRLTIIQNLGVLQDNQTATELRQALNDDDSDVRIAAGWALANNGDAGSAKAICGAADTSEGWERTQEMKACLLMAEKLAAAGKKADAKKVYEHLCKSRKDDSEKYVRDAAFGALKAL